MRKVNRVLMKTAAILLALVLVTSCALSGIFAKYVTSMEIDMESMKMKKFGVTVNMVVDEAKLKSVLGDDYISADDLKKLTAEKQEEAKANKVWVEVSTDAQKQAGVNTVTIHNLALKPGDNLSDIVKFAFSGTANVRCKMIVDVDIDYDIADLTVPAGVGGLTEDTAFFPLFMDLGYNCEFYSFGDYTGSYPYRWNDSPYDWRYAQSFYVVPDGTFTERQFLANFYENFCYYKHIYTDEEQVEGYFFEFTPTGDNSNPRLEKMFDVGEEIMLFNFYTYHYKEENTTYYDDIGEVNNLNFGLIFPFEIDKNDDKWYDKVTNKYYDYYRDDWDYDAIMTYLAYEKNPNVSVTYTIKFEQCNEEIVPGNWYPVTYS